MKLKLLYEDNHLIIVEKKAGVTVLQDKSNIISLIDYVKDYHNKILEEINRTGRAPPRGRFIILYTPPEGVADDLGEEVENYLLANPVELGVGPGGGAGETVIQIMIEEEGAYGMLPFVE